MKTVVISGANRGVGYGIAKCFFKKGYKVIGLNKTFCNEKWLEEIFCDVTCKNNIEEAINEIITKYGKIDILVNNAAIRRFSTIAEISDTDWIESIQTNLAAPLWLIQKTGEFLARTKGLIIIVGSHAWENFFEEGVAYSSSKSALHALAQTALKEMRYSGVRVCYLSLGAIANRSYDTSEWKIQPEDIGQLITAISELPARVTTSYIDLRPTAPKKQNIKGIELLQYL